MEIQNTMGIEKPPTKNNRCLGDDTPWIEDNQQTTLKNSIYLQLKIVYVRAVDNSTSVQNRGNNIIMPHNVLKIKTLYVVNHWHIIWKIHNDLSSTIMKQFLKI